jgi:hypothetical protein
MVNKLVGDKVSHVPTHGSVRSEWTWSNLDVHIISQFTRPAHAARYPGYMDFLIEVPCLHCITAYRQDATADDRSELWQNLASLYKRGETRCRASERSEILPQRTSFVAHIICEEPSTVRSSSRMYLACGKRRL